MTPQRINELKEQYGNVYEINVTVNGTVERVLLRPVTFRVLKEVFKQSQKGDLLEAGETLFKNGFIDATDYIKSIKDKNIDLIEDFKEKILVSNVMTAIYSACGQMIEPLQSEFVKH